MKRSTTLSATTGVAVTAVLLSGCGGSNASDASGPVKIDFWHSTSGVPADTLVALVEEFNSAHDDVTVTPIFQGAYPDSMSKLTNAVQSGDLPALIQGGDTFSTYLRDSGLTVPPTDIDPLDGARFTGNDVVPALANYYTFDGVLSSVPIMVSQPVIVYNTALLEAAGIDPAQPPATLEEFFSTAATIHASTGTAGLTMFTDAWWAEQFSASEGIAYCTPDNGVGSEAAGSFQYDDPSQVAVWQGVQDLVASGAMLNTGTDGTASLNAFAAGQAALMMQSSRIYGDVTAAADFDFGVWPLPVGSDDGGAVPGGNSVWLVKEGNSDREIAAAASLANFLASPDVQARIFNETGYLPTSATALDELSGNVTDIQQVFLDQLEDTPESVVSAGCHTGAMGEARPFVKSALEEIIGGGDVKTALTKAETAGNKAISEYDSRRN